MTITYTATDLGKTLADSEIMTRSANRVRWSREQICALFDAMTASGRMRRGARFAIVAEARDRQWWAAIDGKRKPGSALLLGTFGEDNGACWIQYRPAKVIADLTK